ncbi:hypothetical protein Btru_069006 [Bulinus truncatus]|nr:hypothetical protein Btru_069006 [Bulinus truncatus]
MLTLQAVIQGIFLFAVITIFLNWLIPKAQNMLSNAFKIVAPEIKKTDSLKLHDDQQKEFRDKFQNQYNSKAAEYKERILKPRKDEIRRKKEEEFLKFLGPAWKGKGSPLGGQTYADGSCDLADSQLAATRRIVQEDINHGVLFNAMENSARRLKAKRIITLPNEPNVYDPDAVTVLFRTPIGNSFDRRFYSSNNVQCLLDFITTKGFSYKKFDIATSYPRILLNDPSVTIAELNFGKRIVLNIEEKDI